MVGRLLTARFSSPPPPPLFRSCFFYVNFVLKNTVVIVLNGYFFGALKSNTSNWGQHSTTFKSETKIVWQNLTCRQNWFILSTTFFFFKIWLKPERTFRFSLHFLKTPLHHVLREQFPINFHIKESDFTPKVNTYRYTGFCSTRVLPKSIHGHGAVWTDFRLMQRKIRYLVLPQLEIGIVAPKGAINSALFKR